MATPKNPLDEFVTYTYHFELHAAPSFEMLKPLGGFDANARTTPKLSTDTLLINTRRDAHQTIDDVRFQLITNDASPNASMVAASMLSLHVSEPGHSFFIEKLKRHTEKYNLSGLTESIVFALKIFFVGRRSNNTISTIPLPYVIPMQMVNTNASFDYRGGDYRLEFVISAFAGSCSSAVPTNVLALQAGYVNRNLTIRAKTVREAMSQLEEKLNSNYKKTYETELDNSTGARPYSYKINYNLNVDGPLDLITKDSFRDGDYVKLTFHPNEDIVSMCRTIVSSSTVVNTVIGSSISGVNRELHPGVRVPTFTPRYHLRDSSVELAVDINFYSGGGKQYTFDFLFTKPGQNVDVMEFEVRFPHLVNVLTSVSEYGHEQNSNWSSTVPRSNPQYYKNQLVTPDTTREQIEGATREARAIDARRGDVAPLPSMSIADAAGHPAMRHDAVPARRLAFTATSGLVAAVNMQLTFLIRGHLDLLSSCVAYPDGTKEAFGTTEGLWIKVNIRDEEGNPFYYTGFYKVITIENVFSSGKFTQLVTVMMMSNPNSDNVGQTR